MLYINVGADALIGPMEGLFGEQALRYWFLDTGCLWIPLLVACRLSSNQQPASVQ